MNNSRAIKQSSEIDLSTTMVYVQDVERDAESSASSHRIHGQYTLLKGMEPDFSD